VGGWFASVRVGPASIDWESVAPLAASGVELTLPTGTQRWWVVPRNDSVAVTVKGGTPLRVEFRMLLAPERTDTGRYVVAVSVDGAPHDWEAFTATPDSNAVLLGAVVGDRDRLEFTLPPGKHAVRIAMLAGHGEGLLVRVRRPE
jgi:hypothetical protein